MPIMRGAECPIRCRWDLDQGPRQIPCKMIHNVLREVPEYEKAPVEPFSAHGRLAASSRLRTRRAQSHNDLAACFSMRACRP
jgi:hypothetical protein